MYNTVNKTLPLVRKAQPCCGPDDRITQIVETVASTQICFFIVGMFTGPNQTATASHLESGSCKW